MAEWMGAAVGGPGWPVLAMVVLITAVTIFLTELTSDSATSAAFLPLVASIAVGLDENPFLLVISAALAASRAFMLLAATPPNAIIFESGALTAPQMARVGIWLNIVSIVLITAPVYTLAMAVFGIDLGVLPPWAQG